MVAGGYWNIQPIKFKVIKRVTLEKEKIKKDAFEKSALVKVLIIVKLGFWSQSRCSRTAPMCISFS